VGTPRRPVKAAVRDTRRAERTGPEKRPTARGGIRTVAVETRRFTLIELLIVYG
jgi:hypothetical protein